jgi:hypothetical protein
MNAGPGPGTLKKTVGPTTTTFCATCETWTSARGFTWGEDLLQRLADAARGTFTVAELYVIARDERELELNAWRKDPRSIPRGLEGWLDSEWSKLSRAAATLGLLALARVGLSGNLMAEVLEGADAAGVSRMGSAAVADLLRHFDHVIKLASGLFRSSAQAGSARAVYQFFHPDFAENVANRLSDRAKRQGHRALAALTGDGPTASAERRRYADNHRMIHLLGAEMWDEAGMLYAGDLSDDQLRAATQALADFLLEGESGR